MELKFRGPGVKNDWKFKLAGTDGQGRGRSFGGNVCVLRLFLDTSLRARDDIKINI